jgi:hypothetical protein
MNEPADYQNLAVLQAFFREMNSWERDCWSRRKDPDIDGRNKRHLASMQEIFVRYCTPKERKYGRLGSYSNPPEYDPQAEKILEQALESSRRAVITTQQTTGFCHKCRYVLLRRGNQWLVDNKQWQDHTGKWNKVAL